MRARASSFETTAAGAQSVRSGLSVDAEDDGAAPIRAGMRARAIADACEKLDLPAVMIDGSARVLHVGASLAQMRDSGFTVTAGHLVGPTDEANRRVERAIMVAIGSEVESDDEMDAVGGTVVKGLPVRDPSPYQIMRGIVILAPWSAGTAARLGTLRAMLG